MTYTTGFNEQEPQAELIKNTFNYRLARLSEKTLALQYQSIDVFTGKTEWHTLETVDFRYKNHIDIEAENAKQENFVNAVEYKNSYQEQLEQLCRKRWLALHEIATEGKKRGVDWCVEKAREGEA